MVDGRYRILDRIGSGGMADVYLADDTHLGRRVALKVLHRRFAEDGDFVERFRREASSAAGLQHPNVVSVFDRGGHDGTYYIAMEHLPGRTLKDVVTTEAPLSQLRAVHFGLQLALGAGFAHRRGVIHRDLKSQNAIVDENDTLKVTDFGIARAGASEMTETGSIMGTAQYLSPEQAQGHSVTAASDLYSIGVMMYEMLAGRLPFDGDSAVSVAVKHLSESPVPLAELRPDIHPLLEAAVMRCLAKDPSERYASADELAADLEAARAAMVQPGETAMYAPVMIEEEYEPLPEDRRRRWPFVLLALLLLALIAAVAYALTRPQEIAVPGVEGQQVESATRTLERAGFEVRVKRQEDPKPVGEVIDQDPESRQDAEEGSTVTLTVSSGPGSRAVPQTRNLSPGAARKRLAAAGFKVDDALERRPSDDVPEGSVIGTEPPAALQKPIGSQVKLIVSSGPEQVPVPDVVGLTRAIAEEQLTDLGLTPQVEVEESEEPIDRVIAQSPADGKSVDEGARVVITVSAGPPEPDPADQPDDPPAPAPDTATVPDVVDLSEADATSELEAAGFVVRTRVVGSGGAGTVTSQSPSGGSELRSGRTVNIVVRRSGAGGQPSP